MSRVLIAGGTVATARGSSQADVLLENGVILEVGSGLPREGARLLDATGCLVMPGGVDVHTHFALDVGTAATADGFGPGTRAAALGGVTCIVEHPGFGPAGCSLTHQTALYHALAHDVCHVDYSFHGVAQGADPATLSGLPALLADGCPSLKAYTTYAGRLDEAGLLALMEAVASQNGRMLVAVHCEDHALVAWSTDKLRAAGRLDPSAHPLSRPGDAEELAVRQACALARATGAALYVVHLSTAQGLVAIREARQRGTRVVAETCPQYLMLDASLYAGPDGLGLVMAPPLRSREDRDALWSGLENGDIQVAATDHCALSLADKKRLGANDVFACPGGVAGVATRLPLLYTHGVASGRLSLERFVDVCCTAPAGIMGLSRKGRLEPGLDADVTVLDPGLRKTIRASELAPEAGFLPFEGMEAAGWPRHVLVRGLPVVTDGTFTGEPGWGRFVHRTLTGNGEDA